MEVAICLLMGGQEGDIGDFHSCSMVPLWVAQQPGDLARAQAACVFFLGLSCGFRKSGLLPPFQLPNGLPHLGDQLWDLHHLGCR